MYNTIKWLDRHLEAIFVVNTFIVVSAYFFFTIAYIFPYVALTEDQRHHFVEPEWASCFQFIGYIFFFGSFVYLLMLWGKWYEFRTIGRLSLILNTMLISVNAVYAFSGMQPDLYYGLYLVAIFIIFTGVSVINLSRVFTNH